MFLGFLSRNGALGPVSVWKLADCITVHRLLETVFDDQGAASSKSLSISQLSLQCVRN